MEDYVEGRYNGPKFQSEKEILRQTTQGLAHLHSLEIIHRDIKPTNILVFVPEGDDDFTRPLVKLGDFGIAKILKANSNDFTNTSVTNPKGTRGWMPPEQYDATRFDFKVDIFPLGCIFAYALSGGRHPFGEDTDERIFRVRKHQRIPNDFKKYLKQSACNSEEAVAFKLIKCMLDMDPNKRPTAENVLMNLYFTIYSVKIFNAV